MGVPRAVRETDWKQIAERVVRIVAQGVRSITHVLLIVRDTFVGSTGPVRQEGSPADPKKVDGEYSPVFIHRELDGGAVSSSAESSADGLNRRAPFPNVGGNEGD
jgi:hypothetical protein